MADKFASLFVILVGGSLLAGLIGMLMPLILFCLGFGLAVLGFYLLAILLGRIFA
ncbi:hypothetical protein TA3x_000533 [Tundrisphaera sp. TA3]|uniref:hypothetical protein n=1 Tax=Tundrisphaera sp. TA3 TaxID=3435775 RepID=UPI003EB859C5